MYKFEIFRDKANQFRFRFVAPNNQIMFASEGYTRKHDCRRAIIEIVIAFGRATPFEYNVDSVIYESIPRKPRKKVDSPKEEEETGEPNL